jgi:hypothetical protein
MQLLPHLNALLIAYETALEAVLPAVFLLFALMTLTGNFAIKRFFDGCGIDLHGRYLCGAAAGVSGLVLATGLSSCHATTAMIALSVFLAGMARRGGANRIAILNLGVAAMLTPVVVVP